jgi:hypothetical protein
MVGAETQSRPAVSAPRDQLNSAAGEWRQHRQQQQQQQQQEPCAVLECTVIRCSFGRHLGDALERQLSACLSRCSTVVARRSCCVGRQARHWAANATCERLAEGHVIW